VTSEVGEDVSRGCRGSKACVSFVGPRGQESRARGRNANEGMAERDDGRTAVREETSDKTRRRWRAGGGSRKTGGCRGRNRGSAKFERRVLRFVWVP
jgi:hypothetical protein